MLEEKNIIAKFEFPEVTQRVYRFPNGYGLNIIEITVDYDCPPINFPKEKYQISLCTKNDFFLPTEKISFEFEESVNNYILEIRNMPNIID